MPYLKGKSYEPYLHMTARKIAEQVKIKNENVKTVFHGVKEKGENDDK